MRLFALIGYPLTHSFSQKYFSQKFIVENIIDASFTNFSFADINEINELLSKEKNLAGFAITIPHKKNIIPFLDDVSDEVKLIGACNCVVIKEGKLIGYNTDIIGFEESFKVHLKPHHTKALVLGTGGANAAVLYVLNKLGIQYQQVSRVASIEKNYINYESLTPQIIKEYSIIINTTPLGTFPEVNTWPLLPYEALTHQHYLYDLVYNPSETKFLELGKEYGATIQNGYPMLTIQAEANWNIWNR